NYWRYAHDFVLQDHLFEPVNSWSLPQHLFLVSGWSAHCATSRASSCVNDPAYRARASGAPISPGGFAWTDLTYLLHKYGVSWAYYVEHGNEPDCEDDAATCGKRLQDARTPGIWNPLPRFTDVRSNGQLNNVKDFSAFRKAAQSGSLPAVSWVTPS